MTPETVEIILAEYPRLGFKKAFLEARGAVIRREPMTDIINLMGDVGGSGSTWTFLGFCDAVSYADFDE